MTHKQPIVFDFMRTLYDPLTARLYPGVATMLADLKGKRKLILYSRKERSRHELLRELGIDECFDAAYFVEMKDASNLLSIMIENEIDPKACVVVGDIYEAELLAAKTLGSKTVLVRHQYGSVPQTDGPTYTVGSIAELNALLQTLD